MRRAKRLGRPALLDPDLFKSPHFRLGISQQTLQQIALGGLMIVLPIYLQMVHEYNALEAGLSIAPLSISMFVVALIAGRKGGGVRPSTFVRYGFLMLAIGVAAIIALVPRVDTGLGLALPLIVAGSGLGLLVSQLNNYTLAPVSEERVSEAASVNSAAGSFGLSFGLAAVGAVMLATLAAAFTQLSDDSDVLTEPEKTEVAVVLEEDAQIMTNTALEAQLADKPEATQAEIIDINTDARHIALQIALVIPLLVALGGLVNSFRMARLPDVESSGEHPGLVVG